MPGVPVSEPLQRSLPCAVDRQLLWRELWLGASGAADWWRRQRCFAASAAAMSVVSDGRGRKGELFGFTAAPSSSYTVCI